MLALAALVGCSGASSGTSEKHVGGPSAATNASQKEPIVGVGDGEFKLKPPTLAVRLKQGESKEARIDIERGKNFDKDVTLKFADTPKDVEIKPDSPVIKHSDTGVVLIIKAKDEAAVGDFKVKITAHPTEGKDAVETLEIKVSAK